MHRPFYLSSTWNTLIVLEPAKLTDQIQLDHVHRKF